jgi:hypothetical protein
MSNPKTEEMDCLICYDCIETSVWYHDYIRLHCHHPICIYCLCRLQRAECPYCTQSLSIVGPPVVQCVVRTWYVSRVLCDFSWIVCAAVQEFAMMIHPELYDYDYAPTPNTHLPTHPPTHP